ncbi:hypothetical protein F5Y15DRAFT_332918 [Xylariaceae sp. FL0016]|nr:hypothetical protein F5Y15DRAFT_332918 [Xylariaceae sp. FL0016]
MPFPYQYICDLLEELECDFKRSKTRESACKTIISTWFGKHRARLNDSETDACAILSTILPERRTDRVYAIQATRLEGIVGKTLLLGSSRVKELRRYRTPGSGVDLADCVAGIFKHSPYPTRKDGGPTVEDVDAVLAKVAASCRFSSPAVRSRTTNTESDGANNLLIGLYQRLSPNEAKWFTRLVLKSYAPVVLNHHTVFSNYHRLLPLLLKVRDDLTVTTELLQHLIHKTSDDQIRIAKALKPKLGVKIGRQQWFKGRSIKHCLDMGRKRVVSCEQKLDGEYCQIHVDRSKGSRCIQIFSKSGKDSTIDRIGIHDAIRGSLRLDMEDCPIRMGCILEGELVVYSSREQKILPFHKIRKHVSRSGSFIGTPLDSQAHGHEHLMIVYYDVLMIDNESLLGSRKYERMDRLTRLINCRVGHAAIVNYQMISFSSRSAAARLREAFARCIINRSEGLVLKPNEPYFDFAMPCQDYSSCNIKLKKEYMQGWGDVGDFAVVGASYDSAKAQTYHIENLKWTHFYIGCLENKTEAVSGSQRPRYIVSNTVELNATMLKSFISHCNTASVSYGEGTRFDIDFQGLELGKHPAVLFVQPPIFDIRSFSFDKAPNTTFWSIRFPMVSKIHFDRTWEDVISFEELQEAAVSAITAPSQEESQEMRNWISALEKADPRGAPADGASQQSSDSGLTVSPTAPYRTALSNNRVLEDFRGDVSVISHVISDSPAVMPPSFATPPRSSAVSDDSDDSSKPSAHYSMKRKGEPIRPQLGTKRSRRSSQASTTTRASSLRDVHVVISPIRKRQPLGQVDINTTSSEQSPSQLKKPDTAPVVTINEISSAIRRPSSSPAGSFHTASGSPSSPDQQNQDIVMVRRHSSTRSQPPTPESSVPACLLAGLDCALAKYCFILSPCIATYAWITDMLLDQHAINHVVVDPLTWREQDLRTGNEVPGSRAATYPHQPDIMPKHRRRRKICLVESRRKEATKAFMEVIKQANLKTKRGDPDYVMVYDWRLLESITDRETHKRSREVYDPFRKYFVDIV